MSPSAPRERRGTGETESGHRVESPDWAQAARRRFGAQVTLTNPATAAGSPAWATRTKEPPAVPVGALHDCAGECPRKSNWYRDAQSAHLLGGLQRATDGPQPPHLPKGTVSNSRQQGAFVPGWARGTRPRHSVGLPLPPPGGIVQAPCRGRCERWRGLNGGGFRNGATGSTGREK